jgi:acyl-CoA thioesterase FadM
MLYRIYKSSNEKQTEVAHAKTGMVCFDYNTRKVAEIKEGLLKVLTR